MSRPRSLPPPRKKPTRAALRRELRELARAFADELLEVLERHGLWDEPEEADDELDSRRIRRSPEALSEAQERILGALSGHKQPVAISTLAADLGVTPRDIAHPIALLVGQGEVIKSGTRRGTRYQLVRRRTRRPPPPKKKRSLPRRAKRR